VAPLEMNAGTCWGKNTIDSSGRGIEKTRKATLTFNFHIDFLYNLYPKISHSKKNSTRYNHKCT
jgi:hypothetical protein